MATFGQLGAFIGGAKTANGAPVKLFDLRVYPRSVSDSAAGQWVLRITPDRTENYPQCIEKFTGVTARLGLSPIHFVPAFANILSEAGPLCVVADTNALFHGLLSHVIRVRQGHFTHVAIPDQVMMELQRQREQSWIKTGTSGDRGDHFETWSLETNKQPKRVAAARVLRRLRDQGVILHLARPPDALVRYFGGSAGGPDAEDGGALSDFTGPNYFRDRLILEAAYNLRAELPQVPVWLLTADANLAAHAHTEGFNVAFGWRAHVPSGLVTSPHIDPRLLRFFHVPIDEFLLELIWSWRSLWIQPVGEPHRFVSSLPSDRRSEVLSELNDTNLPLTWKQESCDRKWSSQTPTLTLSPGASTPAKAPTPQALIQGLMALGRGPVKAAAFAKFPDAVGPYLKALGWASTKGNAESLSIRGQDLLNRWTAIGADPTQWYEFISQASGDIRSLQPVERLLGVLKDSVSQNDESLAKHLHLSARTAQTLATLANAFGLCARVQGKTWGTVRKSIPMAEDLIRQTVLAMQEDSEVPAVPIERVFTKCLDTNAVDLPTFRIGIIAQVDSGQMLVSGTSPSENPVKIRVLRPINNGEPEHVETNLGAGDWLVPGRVAQVVWIEKVQE